MRHTKLAGALAATVLLPTMLAMPAGAATEPSSVQAAPTGAAPYIVTVTEGIDPSTVAADVEAVVEHRYDTAVNGFAADLTEAQRTQLAADPRVTGVNVDKQVRIDPGKPDPVPPGQFPQGTPTGHFRVGLLDSKTASVDKKGPNLSVDIAVFDTGVDPTHIDLNVAGGVDCTGSGTWTDPTGHGTMVAGITGAIDNAYGMAGIAPGARIWSVRVLGADGYGTDSQFLCGIEWLVDNAPRIEVANMSLGDQEDVAPDSCGLRADTRGKRKPRLEVVDPVHAALCQAVARGTVIVASAGNEARDAATHTPSAYPEVIAVSAFTETDGYPGGLGPEAQCLPGEFDDHFATFSNFGPTVDFAAPGVCVVGTYPGQGYALDSGTSFAAPFVAGAAALVKVRTPSMSPARVKEKLLQVAERAPLAGDPDGITEPIIDVGAL